MVSLPASSLLHALWLLASNVIFGSVEAGKKLADDLSPPSACLNCSLCGSCYPNAPPPPEYTQYGVPPPPPPAQAGCPPSPVAPCCQYQNPPPNPSSYLPYYNYSASPPSMFSGRAFSYIFSATSIMLIFSGAVV